MAPRESLLLFILESLRTFEVSDDERKTSGVNEGRDQFNYEKTSVNQSAWEFCKLQSILCF